MTEKLRCVAKTLEGQKNSVSKVKIMQLVENGKGDAIK